MISERKLASAHSSFWRNAMPMADSFVRNMNRTLTRLTPPCPTQSKGMRNSLISELSFRLYSLICNEKITIQDLIKSTDLIKATARDVNNYISRLERLDTPIPEMNDMEINDAISLTDNLRKCLVYSNPGMVVTTQPKFKGCGIVDDCEGDILVGGTLYELKNVDRDFRVTDLRQVLTYCALSVASGQTSIEKIGLLNARSGLSYVMNINKLAYLAAGISADELLREVIRYITSDSPSR